MSSLQWHTMGRDDVFTRLKTDRDGLSEKEAETRLAQYGPNALPQKKATSVLRLFFQQFFNPLIAVLLVAALVTAALREWADTIVIGVAIIVNVLIGFIQEYKAERALLALLQMITEETNVLREGRYQRIVRERIVPGDIVVLKSGDRIPADLRLIEAHDLEMNEAILTGESLPQSKTEKRLTDHRRLGDIRNMAYAGTVVTRGSGLGVVVATGLHTEIGKIAQELQTNHEETTPLQEKLGRFSAWLSWIVLGLAFFVFVLGLVFHRPPLEMFTIAVALAVAAIPEGLVVGVTAILAIGMHRLVQCNAIVRRLLAAETLGSTTVICTDKTGTLTKGDMQLVRVVTESESFFSDREKHVRESVRHALTIGATVSESVVDEAEGVVRVFGSPTERAITLGALTHGIRKSHVLHEGKILDTLPFHSERKLSAVLYETKKKRMLWGMGAPDRLLPNTTHILRGEHRVELRAAGRKKLEEIQRRLGEQGLRIVSIVERPYSASHIQNPYALTALTFVAFLVLQDPVREGVPAMIRRAKEAGITTVMVTGDHRSTATSIAQELGLPCTKDHVMTGEEFMKLTPKDFTDRVSSVSVYARVVPSEKVRIIDAWQARGDVVAMTGDGVNDAPALHKADIGIAVGTATDVAKEAADLVLLDNDFGTIVRAVEEGRVIMDNVRKVILYLLSDSFAQVVLILAALLLDWPLPLLAAQILWINLVGDGFPDLALTLDPGEREVMNERPIPRRAPLLDFERKTLIGAISLVMGIGNLLLFGFFWNITGSVETARTVVFVSMGLSTISIVFSCRSLRCPVWRTSLFSNLYLVLAVCVAALIQVVALYVPFLQQLLRTRPLTFFEWSFVFVMVLANILLVETIKMLFLYRRHHEPVH